MKRNTYNNIYDSVKTKKKKKEKRFFFAHKLENVQFWSMVPYIEGFFNIIYIGVNKRVGYVCVVISVCGIETSAD